MKFARKFSVCPFHFFLRGILFDAQGRIIILVLHDVCVPRVTGMARNPAASIVVEVLLGLTRQVNAAGINSAPHLVTRPAGNLVDVSLVKPSACLPRPLAGVRIDSYPDECHPAIVDKVPRFCT